MNSIKGLVIVVAAASALLAAPVAAQQPQPDPRAQERLRQQQERQREHQERQREHQERQRAMSSRQYPAQQTERITRTLKVGGRGEIQLSNLSGDITITRGGGNDVEIEAVKMARGRDENDAREMLALVQVEFSERSGRGEARVSYPHERGQHSNRRNINVSVAFNVRAPENTRITVKTLSGGVRVTDIKGELSLTSTSGDVSVTNAARVLSARSTSGSVEILNTTSQNAIDANSISGNVTVRRVRAPRMQLGTISGGVFIHDVETSRIEAQSLSGDVELATPLVKNGRYDLNSHSGTVRIVLVGDSGFELDANTFSGGVRSEVELKGTHSDAQRAGRSRSLRGVFGDGSALLDVTTFSGNVIVTRK